MTFEVRQGDCVALMAAMPANSVDAICTDPPYGLEFMGKDWDRIDGNRGRHTGTERQMFGKGMPLTGSGNPTNRLPAPGFGSQEKNPKCAKCNRYKWSHVGRKCDCEAPDFRRRGMGAEQQAWHQAWATEALRVLKPGGYLIAAGGSRTYHRLTCAIEDAGFEIRDCITWLFGSGFPKSLNVSEALRGLPACTCDVAGELGTIDPGSPAGTVRAGVGTEPRAVPLAGFSADGTGRVGAEASASAPGAVTDVEDGVKQVDGEASPVVLGSTTVAGVAAGDEVGPGVGGVEVDPEALRDQVVGDGGGALAVEADGTIQDARADLGPADPLVLPLAAAPGGVTGASESAPVGDGHTVPGAVDGDPLPVAGAGPSAFVAGEGRHPTKCKACGGVRGQVPDGFGTALKPAAEFWVVARKPLSGTVAATVLEHGTGALNVDATRIGYRDDGDQASAKPGGRATAKSGALAGGSQNGNERQEFTADNSKGRWPANVVLDEEAARLLDEQTGERGGSKPIERPEGFERFNGQDYAGGKTYNAPAYTSPGYADQGGASRFFYCAKSSRGERNAGLEGFEERDSREGVENSTPRSYQINDAMGKPPILRRNNHPTVKPISLMRWLVRLVTPPGGTVLDPFTGSGSTGCAAVLEGFAFIGLEREPEYVEIARARISWWLKHRGDGEASEILAAGEARDEVEATGQLDMFDHK